MFQGWDLTWFLIEKNLKKSGHERNLGRFFHRQKKLFEFVYATKVDWIWPYCFKFSWIWKSIESLENILIKLKVICKDKRFTQIKLNWLDRIRTRLLTIRFQLNPLKFPFFDGLYQNFSDIDIVFFALLRGSCVDWVKIWKLRTNFSSFFVYICNCTCINQFERSQNYTIA